MSETLEPFFIVPESLVSSDRQDHEPNRNKDNGFDKRPQASATPLGQELSSHIIEYIYGLPGFCWPSKLMPGARSRVSWLVRVRPARRCDGWAPG
jgi:hypothetical protein